jgi:hypothetical protein
MSEELDFEEEEVRNEIGDIVNHAVDGNPSALGDVVDSVLKSKAYDYINNMKDDISKNFFGSGETDVGEED